MRKQDKQGARTVAELNRRYNVKKGVSQAMGAATEAERSAKVASQAASEAQQGLTDKVGKKDYDTVVEMLNKSNAIVKLLANRIVIESNNFSITEEGEVTVKTSKYNGILTKTAELKDGIIALEPDYTITSEGENITFELLRFKYGSYTYGLYLHATWVEDSTSDTGLRLDFLNFNIGLIEE
jgi:hypothetical protein